MKTKIAKPSSLSLAAALLAGIFASSQALAIGYTITNLGNVSVSDINNSEDILLGGNMLRYGNGTVAATEVAAFMFYTFSLCR